MNNNTLVDLQIVCENTTDIPTQDQFIAWANCVLRDYLPIELTIRIVDLDEIATLNKVYRHKEGATNILSFPTQTPFGVVLETPLLGDLVICHDVVVSEAVQQKKSLLHHYAHLTIHGILHLQGYDHQNDMDAMLMENMEITLLKAMNIPNPYGDAQHG